MSRHENLHFMAASEHKIAMIFTGIRHFRH